MIRMSSQSTPLSSHSRAPAGLFSNRGFLLLWAAYGISAAGDHIAEMAVLKALNAMGDPNATGLTAMLTFMFFVPFFVFGPFNGILADRLPRRGIMIAADLFRALIFFQFSFLLAFFADWGRFGHFMPFLMVGMFAALFSPARSALLPSLIRPDHLVRANAMISGLGVIASMAATLIGGYLADWYAPQITFNINALTFIGSACCLVFIHSPPGAPRPTTSEGGLASLAAGVRYVREHRRVAQLIGVVVVVWLVGPTVVSSLPAIVRDAYQQTSYRQITLFRAFFGLGMVSGSLILTGLGSSLRSEIAITYSLFGVGTALVLMTTSVLAPIGTDVRYVLGGAAVMMAGIFGAGIMASYNALLQRIVPNRMRGRVFGLADLCSMGGLLLATGLLGIPNWPGLDRWVGWILLGTAMIPLWAGVVSLRTRLTHGQFSPRINFWWNATEFYCTWWFRLKREGICRIPTEGPVIVVANHTCPIDPLLLVAACRHRVLSFMVAREFSNPVIGRGLIRMLECIPVNRDGHDAAATRAALRHLKDGKALAVFIEGKIAKPGEVLEPKDGPALLALRTGAIVVPAFISGTIYTEGILQSFLVRHKARVRWGKPVDVREIAAGRDDKETVHEISRMLMSKIRELGLTQSEDSG